MTTGKARILALDTAAEACSAAVWRDGAVAAHRLVRQQRGHAETLMPMIVDVMGEAAVTYDTLTAIAVTAGPGTFTGLRIGVAAARGLALASRKPLVPISTLEAIAGAAIDQELVPADCDRGLMAAMDARRGQVYAQVFDCAGTMLSEAAALAAPAAAALCTGGVAAVVGSGAHLLVPFMTAGTVAVGDVPPDASTVARLAAARTPQPADTVRPVYLRAPDAVPRATNQATRAPDAVPRATNQATCAPDAVPRGGASGHGD